MIRTACKVVAVLIVVGGLLAAALSVYATLNTSFGVSLLTVLPSTLMLILVSAAVGGVLWMLASIDGRLETLNQDKR